MFIKTKILKNKDISCLKLSDVILIMILNVKMPTIVGILTFRSMINFMLSSVEHEKSSITLEPGHQPFQVRVFDINAIFRKMLVDSLWGH